MADKLIGQYDPRDISQNLGLVSIPVEAYADGTVVNATRTTPERYRKKVGVGGGVTRVRVTDESGTVEITLKAEHPINDQLRTLYNQTETFPYLLVKGANSSGREERIISDQAWVEADSDISLSDDEENRTWIIGMAEMVKI